MVSGVSNGVTIILIIPEFKLAEIVPRSNVWFETVPNSDILIFAPSNTMLSSVLLKWLDEAFDI
jgi:hypothetical protein